LEIVVNTDAFAELPADLQAIIEAAALQCAMETLGQFDWFNVTAMGQLQEAGVEFLAFPDEVVAAMKTAWGEVKEETRAASSDAARVLESIEAWEAQAHAYSAVFLQRYLADRG
jgi:TRAP-type mannitol/chloroaromatic compound transport system substrate-binding protein